jgi:hypothetical protein
VPRLVAPFLLFKAITLKIYASTKTELLRSGPGWRNECADKQIIEVSGVSAASGLKSGQFDRKRNY